MWRTLGPRTPFMVPLVSSLVLAPLLWIKLGSARGKAGASASEVGGGGTSGQHLVPLEDEPASADA
ncbi:MAG: hypothetical protein BWY92_00738 [Firmicutes bacterium ADurb.BinA052]|nr:MAG: hypothetical protein BWY92_00738 [Firmicutes bacterium ADurb.BinA052]